MNRDPMSDSMRGDPLPPARTRRKPQSISAHPGGEPLPPVRSGLFGVPAAAAPWPVHELDQAEPGEAFSPLPPDMRSDFADDEVIELEADAITIEFESGDDAEALGDDLFIEVVEEVAEPGSDAFAGVEVSPWEEPAGMEAAPSEPDATEELILTEADETTAPEPPARPTAPPLSPWDLGAAAASADAEERAARARAEWESFDQELNESLGTTPGARPGRYEYELTDEIAARLEGDSDLPLGGPILSMGRAAGSDTGEPIGELARRLEAFAAALRSDGLAALGRAQVSTDRFDALLASIAAGFLAGREE